MSAPSRLKQFLQSAVEAAASGTPTEVSVREFISHWGAARRGDQIVSRVLADLSASKLATEPDFRQVYIDTTIRLVPVPPTDAEQDESDDEDRDYGLTVGTLPAASRGVTSVNQAESLHVAYTRMLLNEFSQLPVMDSPRSLKGAVTWRSIASALLKSPDATLADATVAASTVRYSEDLLKLVPRIIAEDFVLVVDQTESVAGIVTTADVSELFAERAEMFLMLGEVDQRLRDAIRRRLRIEAIRPLCQRAEGASPLETFDELTMGDYEQILANPACWEAIGWPLDRDEVRTVIDAVRDVRNDVMHFNPDPIEPDRLAKVRGLVELLLEHSS